MTKLSAAHREVLSRLADGDELVWYASTRSVKGKEYPAFYSWFGLMMKPSTATCDKLASLGLIKIVANENGFSQYNPLRVVLTDAGRERLAKDGSR